MPQIVYKAGGFYTSDQRNTGFGSYWNRRAEREDRGEMNPETGEGAF